MSIYLGDKSLIRSEIVFSLPVQLLLGSIPSLSGSQVVFVPRFRDCSSCWCDFLLAPFPRVHVGVHRVDYKLRFFADCVLGVLVPGAPFDDDAFDDVGVMAVEEVVSVVARGIIV